MFAAMGHCFACIAWTSLASTGITLHWTRELNGPDGCVSTVTACLNGFRHMFSGPQERTLRSHMAHMSDDKTNTKHAITFSLWLTLAFV